MPTTRGFFLDVFEVLVVNDPFFARQGDKALTTRSADQSQSHLSCEIDAPGRIGAAIARMGLSTVFVQEGGYLSDILGSNLAAVLAGFEGVR